MTESGGRRATHGGKRDARMQCNQPTVYHQAEISAAPLISRNRAKVPGVTPSGRLSREKNLGLEDFAIAWPVGCLVEAPDDVDGDMIAAGGVPIMKEAMQDGRFVEHDVAFLRTFAGQGVEHRLAGFDTAAGHMPARRVGVANEEDASRLIDQGGADAQRHRPRKAPIDMHAALDDSPQTASTGLLPAASVPGQYSGLRSDLRPGPAAVPRDRSPHPCQLPCQPRRQPLAEAHAIH